MLELSGMWAWVSAGNRRGSVKGRSEQREGDGVIGEEGERQAGWTGEKRGRGEECMGELRRLQVPKRKRNWEIGEEEGREA